MKEEIKKFEKGFFSPELLLQNQLLTFQDTAIMLQSTDYNDIINALANGEQSYIHQFLTQQKHNSDFLFGASQSLINIHIQQVHQDEDDECKKI